MTDPVDSLGYAVYFQTLAWSGGAFPMVEGASRFTSAGRTACTIPCRGDVEGADGFRADLERGVAEI